MEGVGFSPGWLAALKGTPYVCGAMPSVVPRIPARVGSKCPVNMQGVGSAPPVGRV